MHHIVRAWALAPVAFLASCASAADAPSNPPARADLSPDAAPSVSSPVFHKPVHASLGPSRVASRPRPVVSHDALAWTASGDLALIDGKTGAVRSSAAAARLGGARDVVHDPWASRALVFEADADDARGEIASYPILHGPRGPALGARVHEAWVDGDARILASPLGVVVFEQRRGARVKVLFGADTSASAAMPLPASAWIRADGPSFSLHTLAYGEGGALERRAVDVRWASVAPPVVAPIDAVAAVDPPTTRLLPIPARGDALLFDVQGDAIAVRRVDDAAVGPAALLPLGAPGMRIEHAVALDGGETAVLLASAPSRVIAVAVGEAGAPTGADSVTLPGAVRVEAGFFSHDLAALGDHRVLAATSAGLIALDVARDALGKGVRLTPAPAFAGSGLRGPIAAIAGAADLATAAPATPLASPLGSRAP